MGYETSFGGELQISPPLSDEHLAFLTEFKDTRHEPGSKFPDGPDIWCGWDAIYPTTLAAEDGKNYSYVEWLIYLIDHYFVPWGYALDGTVYWDGEESDDRGLIDVRNNVIEVKEAHITYHTTGTYRPTATPGTSRSAFPAPEN